MAVFVLQVGIFCQRYLEEATAVAVQLAIALVEKRAKVVNANKNSFRGL